MQVLVVGFAGNIKMITMKKIIFLLLFIPLVTFGQSIDVLEDKNGYKIFKLNSEKSDYINNLKLINTNNGFSTYNYQETVEYEIINELRYFKNKTSLTYLANKHSTTLVNLKNLNPNIKERKGFIKKTEIILPIKKILRKNSVDNSLFNLFGNKVNSIHLTFEESDNKLKKITLELNQKLPVNYLRILGYNLKLLYKDFSNIIGPTTDYNKPTRNCLDFPSMCIYFEDRISNGTILWQSKNIVLSIFHNFKISQPYLKNLIVSRKISFIDKSFYVFKKNNAF